MSVIPLAQSRCSHPYEKPSGRTKQQRSFSLTYRFSRHLCAALLLVFVAVANAQRGQAPGVLPFSTRSFNVDLASGSITTILPIRSKIGKIPVSFSLVANYQIQVSQGGTSLAYNLSQPGGLGGQLNAHTFGYRVMYTTTMIQDCNGANDETYGGWVVIDGTGAEHPLSVGWVDRTGACFPFPLQSVSTDGSGLTVTTTQPNNYLGGKTIYDNDGYGYGSPTLTDPDGETVTLSGVGFTDSLGATFLSETFSGNYLSTLVYADANGNNISPPFQIAYQSFNLKSNFNCNGLGYTYLDYSDPAISLPISITGPTGAQTKITYETTPGNSGYITGRLASITYDTGGSISYSYSQNGDTRGQNGIDCVSLVVPKITVHVNDNNGHASTWTYANYNSKSTPGNYVVTETDPAGSQTVYSFAGEYQTQAAKYQGGCPTSISGCNGGGTLQRTTTTCYNANFTSCATPNSVPILPISQTDVYASVNGSSSNLVETKHDAYGNTTEVKRYDYGAAAPPTGNPLTDTTFTYAGVNGVSCGSVATYQYDRSCSINTLAASGSSMYQVSQTNYTYTNGHPTQTSNWVSGTNYLTTTASFNSNGTIAWGKDAAGNQTTFTYSSSICNGILPTSVTPPISTLAVQLAWDCNGGVLTSYTDANGAVTAYGYHNEAGAADPLWRLLSVSDPLNNITWTDYSPGGTLPETVDTHLNFPASNPTSTVDSFNTLDGLGRVVQSKKRTAPGGTSFDNTVQYTYGWTTPQTVGGPFTIPGPYVQQTIPGGTAVTTTQMDGANRVASATDGGGGTVTHTYTQNDDLVVVGPHPTNENNKQVQNQYDGLGRLQYSCAIGNGATAACAQNTGSANGVTTAFSYTSASGSTTVTATRGSQTRSKTYDALGRLTSETNPESGTKTYTYDVPTTACANPAWNGNMPGTLTQTQDAAGNITCFYSDAFGRLATTFVASGGQYCKTYSYDNPRDMIGNTLLERCQTLPGV